MTREEALGFLRRHQPMPDDEALSEELVARYDRIREYFIANPDPEAVPLFLNSFGRGDGFGVYQLVEDVLAVHDPDVVITALNSALNSGRTSVSYWSAQIAANYPDASLIQPLGHLLEKGDFDTKYAAITALEQIGGPAVLLLLRNALEREPDDELRDLLEEVSSAKMPSGDS